MKKGPTLAEMLSALCVVNIIAILAGMTLGLAWQAFKMAGGL